MSKRRRDCVTLASIVSQMLCASLHTLASDVSLVHAESRVHGYAMMREGCQHRHTSAGGGCQGPWLSMHAGGSDSSEHRWGCKPSMATAKPDSHQSSRGPDEGPMIDVLRYITDMNMPYKECISGYL